MKNFNSDTFTIQLIAKGSFVDNSAGSTNTYLVEVFTLRLNHIAFNEWLLSEMLSKHDCFNTTKEWEAHKAKYKARRDTVNMKIIEALGIDPESGSVSITQLLSEVFTVIYIRKMA
jgi:hypothetical protein